MKIYLISILLGLILQSFVISIPIIIPFIIFGAVAVRTNLIFIIAFLTGIVLDVFALNYVGFSSLFLVSLVFIIYLYQRKFEIDNFYFVSFFTFIATLIYLFIHDSSYIALAAFFNFLLAGVSFLVYKLTTNKRKFSYR